MDAQFSQFCFSLLERMRWLSRTFASWGLVFFTAFILSSCESSMVIVNDLEERDANEIIVFLAGHHIDAEKIAKEAGKGGGGHSAPTWNISVKKSDRMRALTLLNNNGLPRRHSQNLLDLFEKQGLVSSELEERIRYQSGLAAQIAGTIRKIDGVLDADVQISFPQEDSLPGQNKVQQPITASVYVKHQGVLDNPNSHLVLKIKRLVASAIPGLDFDRVTVVADRAVFNDPMSLALSKEPDIVSVWGVRVVHDYVLRLQLIFCSLLGIVLVLCFLLGWLVWKLSHLLPALGGLGSVFKATPWQISEKPADSSSSTAPAGVDSGAPSATPPAENKG